MLVQNAYPNGHVVCRIRRQATPAAGEQRDGCLFLVWGAAQRRTFVHCVQWTKAVFPIPTWAFVVSSSCVGACCSHCWRIVNLLCASTNLYCLFSIFSQPEKVLLRLPLCLPDPALKQPSFPNSSCCYKIKKLIISVSEKKNNLGYLFPFLYGCANYTAC